MARKGPFSGGIVLMTATVAALITARCRALFGTTMTVPAAFQGEEPTVISLSVCVFLFAITVTVPLPTEVTQT